MLVGFPDDTKNVQSNGRCC